MTSIHTHKGKHVWPSMRGNEKNSGCSMHAITTSHSDAAVSIVHTGRAIFSTPIIDNEERLYVGSSDKTFYAIDPVQATQNWQVKTAGVIDSAACIDAEGYVYVPSGDASLYKISPDGTQEWALNLLTQKYPRSSTIFWWEGNASIGPNGWIYAGNDDFYLYAIRPDGAVEWTFPTGLQVWSVPAFHDGKVYITSFDMCVYALDQTTGRKQWKRRLHNFIAASPALDEQGNIYVGTFDGRIYSLDGKTGHVRWSVQTNGNIYASAAIAPDGMLYVGSGDGLMYCINAETGRVQWTLAAGSPIWSSAAIGADPENIAPYLVYVGSSNGPIIAFDPFGQYRWAYQVHARGTGKRSGVNASFALGKHGLATATTSGDILYIPYTAYQQQDLHPDTWAIASAGHSLHALPAVHRNAVPESPFFALNPIAESTAFRITNMQCHTPAVINPLDQIGIASLAIDVAIVRSDPNTGRCVAWGVQSFGMGGSDPTDGTLYPRRHVYALSGEQKGDSYKFDVRNCDFDITAFPIPLDTLSFSFALKEHAAEYTTFAAHLNCNHFLFRLFRKYSMYVTLYLTRQTFFGLLNLHTQMYAGQRTLIALWNGWKGRVWNFLWLLNTDGHLDAEGTFSIESHVPHAHHLRFVDASFHAKKRTITATFTQNGREGDYEYPGILLINTATTSAVVLDYGAHLHSKRQGNTVTATLVIPKHVDLSEHLEAIILVDTDMLSTLALPPSR